MTNFSKNLARIMEERHINQVELSRLSGIRQSSISDYLTGQYEPKDKNRNAIANALSVPPEKLTEEDSSQARLIFSDTHFTVYSSTRQLKEGFGPSLSEHLELSTEPVDDEFFPPSEELTREEILHYLRENVRYAAYTGLDYERRPEDQLRAFYDAIREHLLELEKEHGKN